MIPLRIAPQALLAALFAALAIAFTGIAIGACAELAEYPANPVHIAPIAAAKNVRKWVVLDGAKLECGDALRAPGSSAGANGVDAKPLRSDAAMVPVSGAYGVAVVAVELREPCATYHGVPPAGILLPAQGDVIAAAERQNIRRAGDTAPVFELCEHCGPSDARARSHRYLLFAIAAFFIAVPFGLRELRRRASIS